MCSSSSSVAAASQFYKNHAGGKACPDKKIERHYKKFGPWRGLVIWCDMTEKWVN